MEYVPKSYDFKIYAIVVIFSVLWYAILVFRWRRYSPPLPPGPTGLPIVGSLPFLHPELHTYFTRLAQTYGPIFRIKLGTKMAIVVSSPSLAKEVLRDKDSVLGNRDVPVVARIIGYGGVDIVWSPLGPTWRMLRRVCVQELMSTASMDAVYELRRQEVRATVRRLSDRAGEAIDIGEQMYMTMLNATTSMLWGGKVGSAEEKNRMGKEFRELSNKAVELLGLPNVTDFFPYLASFDLQGIVRRSRALMKQLDRIFSSIIDNRRAAKGERKDFLGSMLRMEGKQGDDGTPFTINNIKALFMDFVVGGTDTTSTTMEWALAEMLQKPAIMRRVQEELDRVVGKENIVEESDIQNLHYLGAVIREVLRLYPVVPLLVPHCPTSTCTIGGYTVPQGSRVFLNVWSIHRDPSVWADPLEFKPERFLDATCRQDFKGSNFSYFPFGSGRRICPGIPMAERMTKYVLASLLHSFDWKLPVGEKLDLSEKFGLVLKKAKPLVVIPTPRLPASEQYT